MKPPTTQGVYSLTGKVQHYSWGGSRFIPQLLKADNSEDRPCAEYWLGAHPNFPSTVKVQGEERSLLDVIEGNRKGILGVPVTNSFEGLPYLFKVLDVKGMLSIQVHPSKEEARKGFERENREGVPLTAAHRNYKDANHKPEQMVALGDFYLLHGFKPLPALSARLSTVPELAHLVPLLESGGYRGLYEHVMTMDTAAVNALWQPVAARIVPQYTAGTLAKEGEDFWAARAMTTFCKEGAYDRGLFSIYFLNLVKLERGESVFQPAGMPHAYLEGQNIEVMANSDNVLRGGLTDKHVDVAELMKHTEFISTHPQVLTPDARGWYPTGAAEFALSKGPNASDNQAYGTSGPEIILVLRGNLTIKSDVACRLPGGASAFIAAGTQVELEWEGDTEFYRVSVPRV